MRFVDSYNKKVIYTNRHHLITLPFPFILNIEKYFHLFCRLIPSLNWGASSQSPVNSFAHNSTLRFTIVTKPGRMVVESNISQYAKVVVMSIT